MQQNCVNFTAKCSRDSENFPQSVILVIATFFSSVGKSTLMSRQVSSFKDIENLVFWLNDLTIRYIFSNQYIRYSHH